MHGKQPTFTQMFRRFIEQNGLNAYEISRRSNGKIEKTRVWRAIWGTADDDLADWSVIMAIVFTLCMSMETVNWENMEQIDLLYDEARAAGHQLKRTLKSSTTEHQAIARREPESEPLSPTFQQQKILRNL